MAIKRNTLLLDLFLFSGTVALAWYEQWSAKELVWGLWVSSLILGYSYILSSILGGLIRGDMALLFGSKEKASSDPVMIGITIILLDIFLFFAIFMTFWWNKASLLMALVVIPSLLLGIGAILREKDGWGFLPDANQLAVRIIMLLPVSFFLVGFFSIHFLGFHAVHGTMLNGLFPLIPYDTKLKAFGDLVDKAFFNYWPFILVSALSRLHFYKTAWQRAGVNAMFYPYLNVIRMHLMIFVIGFMTWVGLSSSILYAVLFFYFFPIGDFIKDMKTVTQDNNS